LGVDGGGATIGLRVNGEAVRVAAGMSVRGLIEAHGLGGVPCAAEIDGRLVPRREHEGRVLVEGESVELVSLVGGG
jgi:thiamine biosynthesis protein ThiS